MKMQNIHDEIPGGTGHSILPRYVENFLCVSCTDLAVFSQISCEILVVHSFVKITRTIIS